MTTSLSLFAALSDDDLLARVGALAAEERRATAELIASLAELDARRLYLGAGCSSLFTYCTQVLHLSEHAAYGRIEAARAVRRHPLIVQRLAEGSLTLTSVCLLAPVLSEANSVELLDAARHKSKREVEQLVARVRPQPPVASTVRKLPAPVARPAPIASRDAESCTVGAPAPLIAEPAVRTPPQRPVVRPLAPETYTVQFTLSRDGHDRLRRAQDLLRHTVPNGDVAVIFARALTLLVEDLEKKKLAATARPRCGRPTVSSSRHIPAAVKREVWKREAAGARSSARRAAARSAGSSRFTTSSRLQMVAKRRSRTSSCAAQHTTRTRRSCGSARVAWGSSRRSRGLRLAGSADVTWRRHWLSAADSAGRESGRRSYPSAPAATKGCGWPTYARRTDAPVVV